MEEWWIFSNTAILYEPRAFDYSFQLAKSSVKTTVIRVKVEQIS